MCYPTMMNLRTMGIDHDDGKFIDDAPQFDDDSIAIEVDRRERFHREQPMIEALRVEAAVVAQPMVVA